MSKSVFISHATKNDTDIDRIFNLLTAAGLSAWVDHKEGIELGVNWDGAIRTGIEGCDVGVFVMSPESLQSETCAAECLLVRELKKPLYVLRLSVVEPQHVWTYIKLIQYADLVTNFETGVQRLIRTLDDKVDADDLTPINAPVTGMTQLRYTLPYLFSTPMRGRDEDLQKLQTDLSAHTIQIVGTGGLGKSRLVAEIALKYPQGALWHRCSSTSRDTDVIELARQHYGLPDTAKRPQILAQLQHNPPLIVLDNAEDIPRQSDQRRDYLTLIAELNAQGAPLLLTSRVVWDDLKPRYEYTPRALTLEHGTKLVLDFAASENLTLTEAEARQLADKALLHPRLIEFAVQQLHERDFARVLKQLTELKHTEVKEALDEMIHKTIRQMMEQVANGQQAEALLRCLTIFRGSFTQDAAAALQPDVINDEDALDDALVTLQKWRFVRRDVETKRYRVDELVREAVDVDDTLFPRYADFYITRAAQFDELQPENWGKLDDDLIDITNVGDELVKQTETGTNGDLERALLFAYNTTRYLNRRREVRRIAWTEMGLNAARALQTDVGAQRAASTDPNLYRSRESTFLNELGMVWDDLGENRKALEFYDQKLLVDRELGNRSGEAATLNNIGLVWDDLGEKRKALDFYEQALPIYRESDDKSGEATTLNNIGLVWSDLGGKRKALDFYEQALPLRRAVGDRTGEATILNNIGSVWWALGEQHKALDFYEQSLPILRAVGNRSVEATTLNNIGTAWDALGEKRKALDFYEQALPIQRAVGNRTGEATTLNNVGLVWSELGEKRKALDFYEQALPIQRAVGNRNVEAVTCFNAGREYEDLGDLDKAIEYVTRCVELDEQVEHPDLESDRAYLEELIRKRDAGEDSGEG
jgi:tetratricopeptide (TPR) repeat protein